MKNNTVILSVRDPELSQIGDELFHPTSVLEFVERFNTNRKCLQYLAILNGLVDGDVLTVEIPNIPSLKQGT